MDFPNVTVTDRVRRGSHADIERVGVATKALARVMGDSFAPARVTWDMLPLIEGERQLYGLTVEMPPWGVSVEHEFPRHALASDRAAESKMYEVWGELLKRYNHLLLDRLASTG